MSKISVTTIAGLTSGGDANKVKIESGDDLEVVSGETTLGGGAKVNTISYQLLEVGMQLHISNQYQLEVLARSISISISYQLLAT